MWFKGSLLGMLVLDAQGQLAGRVEGTYPYDGSDPEFAVVRPARCGERVMVPLQSADMFDGVLNLPYGLLDIEDAPGLECARYAEDAVQHARAYWASLDSGFVAIA